MGAWIEITPFRLYPRMCTLSLPSWERGLKYNMTDLNYSRWKSLPSWERGLKSSWQMIKKTSGNVAPLVGAWIEIQVGFPIAMCLLVAPLVGAWIEIMGLCPYREKVTSLPSWERGLKYTNRHIHASVSKSLPSWERGLKYLGSSMWRLYTCRSPRGSVD